MKPEITNPAMMLTYAVAFIDIGWFLLCCFWAFATPGREPLSLVWFERTLLFAGGQLLMCIGILAHGEGLSFQGKQNIWCALASVMLWPLAIPVSFLALLVAVGHLAKVAGAVMGMTISVANEEPPRPSA